MPLVAPVYNMLMGMVAETNAEVEILQRVIAPDEPTLEHDTATMLLGLDFPQEDRERMEWLADKARAGSLTAAEQVEIDSYERVGHFISLLRSKARTSLRQQQRQQSSR